MICCKTQASPDTPLMSQAMLGQNLMDSCACKQEECGDLNYAILITSFVFL